MYYLFTVLMGKNSFLCSYFFATLYLSHRSEVVKRWERRRLGTTGSIEINSDDVKLSGSPSVCLSDVQSVSRLGKVLFVLKMASGVYFVNDNIWKLANYTFIILWHPSPKSARTSLVAPAPRTTTITWSDKSSC